MRIEIKVDGDQPQSETMVFTNESLNNENYVSIIINEIEYLATLDDLKAVINAFDTLRVDGHPDGQSVLHKIHPQE
jgi:hypothetical protein